MRGKRRTKTMSAGQPIHIGLVGAAGRGGDFRAAFEANGARIHAVCDLREDALAASAERLGASERYTDYAEMLDRSDLDAVVLGTPQHLHVQQAVPALLRGLHVLSEVPAGVSLEECRRLVHACQAARGLYMMAENYTYTRRNVLVRELARRGLFGTVYYAEGEYLHELKGLAEQTTWRRRWQLGIEGITYPTHSLGPLLQWMPGDRVVRVCCEASDHRYTDPRGEAYQRSSPVLLGKTAQGALIKIRVDLTSNRPHAMTNYQSMCSKSSWSGFGLAGGQSPHHNVNHRQTDHRLTALSAMLVVLRQTPVLAKPAKGALHHPAPGKNRKALLLGWLLDNLEHPAGEALDPIHQIGVGIDPISPDQTQPGKQAS
jgi:GFO/IDH/MocA oxidoreductase family protein/glycosyl hydrolase family 109